MSTSLIGHEKYLSCRVLLSLEGIFALVQAKLVKIDENMQLKHLYQLGQFFWLTLDQHGKFKVKFTSAEMKFSCFFFYIQI